ncbi:MAG: exonuclease domain-containing protein [Rhizomicrobium sp.]
MTSPPTSAEFMPSAVVFDLEYTAWPGSMEQRWLRPGEHREVVQIGAVKVDAGIFAETASFSRLTRPRLNPRLSPYFEELTGIGNGVLAAEGIDLAHAYRAFIAFADGAPLVSFGRDDLVLADNLGLYGIIDAPPLPAHINIVPWLKAQGIDPRGSHACDVARLAGAAFAGRRHDALDDARSVALGIATLVARGAPHPIVASA